MTTEKKFTIQDFLNNTKNISQMTIEENYKDVWLFDWFGDWEDEVIEWNDITADRNFRRYLILIRRIIEGMTNFAILDDEFTMKLNSPWDCSIWIGKKWLRLDLEIHHFTYMKNTDDDWDLRNETLDFERLMKWLNK
jgi:hypothetical protein